MSSTYQVVHSKQDRPWARVVKAEGPNKAAALTSSQVGLEPGDRVAVRDKTRNWNGYLVGAHPRSLTPQGRGKKRWVLGTPS